MERAITYGIGEVARLTGVTVETLRYYERRRLLTAPPRTSGGLRRYSDQMLVRVRFIKQAQALGLTLDDVRQLMGGTQDRRPSACRGVHDLLARRISEIDARMKTLRELRRTLHAHMRSCEDALDKALEPACPTLDELERTGREAR